MPTFNIDLPTGLFNEVKELSVQHGTNRDTIIVWAVAQLIGELRQARLDEAQRVFNRYSRLESAQPKDNFLAHLIFQNGIEGDIDLKPLIEESEGLLFLLYAPEKYNAMTVSRGGEMLEWGDGYFLEAKRLYRYLLFDD